MSLIIADRVKEITSTTGTGSFSLLGGSVGYRAFSDVMTTGDTCYYCAVSQSGAQWEIGTGTFSSPATLARTSIQSSSNSGSAVDFIAGTKDIFLAITATQFSGSSLPTQTGNSGKFLTTNGAAASWSDNPLGTVTQVQGTGTINGITLTGNVTSSGNLTLGGALTGVNLGSQVTGTLAVTNGGTGTATGSITGTGELVFTAGGSNQNITLNPSGTGDAYINRMRINNYTSPSAQIGIITTLQRESLVASGNPGSLVIQGADATANGSGGSVQIYPGEKAGSGADGSVNIDGVQIKGLGSNKGTVRIGNTSNNDSYSVAVGYFAGDNNSVTGNSEARSIFIGYFAGKYQSDGATPTTNTANSIYIGESAKSLGNSDNNAIVIGSQAIGKGTNSTVIGNTSTNAAWIYGNTLNLGNGASAAAITANGALTVTAGGTNQDVTLTPSGTGKVNAPAIKETVFAITDGASVDINPANGGIQTWTLGANRTPTASSFAEGQSVTLMVDDGTAYAITWSSVSPTWIGGSAPTLATSGFTVIELWKRSSTIYGALVGTA